MLTNGLKRTYPTESDQHSHPDQERKQMTDGLYSVTFRTPRGEQGSGIAVFHDGKVQGGDHAYFYDGTVVEGPLGTADAVIVVRKYAGGESVFGNLAEFRLEVTGVANGDRFTLSGHIASSPDQQLTIECIRLAS